MSDPIEHLKKLAKGLVKKAEAADPKACEQARTIYGDYRDLSDAELGQKLTLGRAQHIVAVEHGFPSWEVLAQSKPMVIRLAITLVRVPDLNDEGIGLIESFQHRPPHAQQSILHGEREVLRRSVERVGLVVDWLNRHVAPIKTINRGRTSYGMKHIVEKDIGYITNGVFIAAGIIAGYPYEIMKRDLPNVSFGMSEQSLKRIEDERRRNPRPYGWMMDANYTDPRTQARRALDELINEAKRP